VAAKVRKLAAVIEALNKEIVERKRAEGMLREKEHFIHQIAELTPVVLDVFDLVTERYIYFSSDVFDLYRYTQDEIARMQDPFSTLLHPQDMPRISEKIARLKRAADGEITEFECRVQRRDGQWRWMESRSVPFARNEQGEVRQVVTATYDVTERKRAEEALRAARDQLEHHVAERTHQLAAANEALEKKIIERMRVEEELRRSEAYLAEGQRLSHTGSGAWNVATGAVFWSQETYRIYGCDPKTVQPSSETFFRLVHPEDRLFVEQTFERVVRKKSSYELEFRIVRPDDEIRHTLSVGSPVISASGELTEVVGTVLDITERKRAEEAERKALEEIKRLKDQLAQEKLYLEEELRTEQGFEEIVGESAALKEILKQVEIVAPTDAIVLIQGETGTGKELIARAIHDFSSRRERTFVKLNCAAIPTGLLEAELFGHEKGAFTGAIAQRIGRFELANGGTLFLDEVGDIPLELQTKLLRVLQEQEFERLGSSRTISVNVRFITASNRDLKQMIKDREFRSDLYYRLKVFPIMIPPLRKRAEDIPLLIRHFVQRHARKLNKRITSIGSDTMATLCRYSWPGNIRELENFVERSVILSRGATLETPVGELQPSNHQLAEAHTLKDTERAAILRALKDCSWVIAGPNGAAAKLGLKRTSLQYKMQKLGIFRPH
jgi:PAS domain S-box-containing protein